MCGIAAFFSTGKRVPAEKLKRATKSLHHRGPDSQGIWVSADHRVGLGHARLSIIDLSTGDQPIANENGGIHIIVNGEFAFVLYDKTNQSLFAARDRFGIKPLYYALHDGTLYLASEIKALFAAGV